MKKLTIADIKPSEILSKEERKMVVGGMELGSRGDTTSGYCVRCTTIDDGPKYSSTWYSALPIGSGSGTSDVCERVYPGRICSREAVVTTSDCIMN